MIAVAVNILGTILVSLCAFLLLRAFTRVRKRLLLWSGLCFGGLAISNALVFVDLAVVPHLDLYGLRLGVAAVSLLVLVYGMLFESD